MSVRVVAMPPIAQPASVGVLGWISGVIEHVRSISGQRLDTRERELVRLIEFGAARLGRPLLAAATLDELDERLDELVESADLARLLALSLVPAAALAHQRAGSVADLAEALDDVIGAGQRRELEHHATMVDAWQHARMVVLSRVSDDDEDMAAVSDGVASFSISDPDLPVEIMEAAVVLRRAELIQLALIEAGLEGRALEPWLARALVERFIASVRKHLRFVAALVPDEIPESIVPRSERVDLQEMERRHRAAREVAARLMVAGEGGTHAGSR
jgi:hypothetical protein